MTNGEILALMVGKTVASAVYGKVADDDDLDSTVEIRFTDGTTIAIVQDDLYPLEIYLDPKR